MEFIGRTRGGCGIAEIIFYRIKIIKIHNVNFFCDLQLDVYWLNLSYYYHYWTHCNILLLKSFELIYVSQTVSHAVLKSGPG